MFSRTRNIKLSQHINFYSKKFFSQTSKFIIIGAGTGGITSAKKLVKEGGFQPNDITIFDPSRIHHYQPGWTKIAGLPNYLENYGDGSYEVEDLLDLNNNDSSSNFNFQNTAVKTLNVDQNSLIDEKGEEWKYEQLIVSCGIKVNHESIPGKIFYYNV